MTSLQLSSASPAIWPSQRGHMTHMQKERKLQCRMFLKESYQRGHTSWHGVWYIIPNCSHCQKSATAWHVSISINRSPVSFQINTWDKMTVITGEAMEPLAVSWAAELNKKSLWTRQQTTGDCRKVNSRIDLQVTSMCNVRLCCQEARPEIA